MAKNTNTTQGQKKTLLDGKRTRKKLAMNTIHKKLLKDIHSYIHIVIKWQVN